MSGNFGVLLAPDTRSEATLDNFDLLLLRKLTLLTGLVTAAEAAALLSDEPNRSLLPDLELCKTEFLR